LKEQSIHPENSDIQRCEYLVVDSNGNEKLIDRVHYTGWVDHQGVEAQVLNQLIDTVDHVAGKDGVITVHCSAGVGRTGTFITARTAKHQLADKAMDSAQIKKEIVDLGLLLLVSLLGRQCSGKWALLLLVSLLGRQRSGKWALLARENFE
jgi:protein tyrosine phosphatase